MIKFHRDAFQFEWPAIEMQGAPIVWHKRWLAKLYRRFAVWRFSRYAMNRR